MTDQPDLVEVQGIEETEKIGRQLLLVVPATRCVAPAVAAQIRHEQPVAVREDRHESAPTEPMLWPSMEQHQWRSDSRLGDVHVQPGDVDQPVGDVGNLRRCWVQECHAHWDARRARLEHLDERRTFVVSGRCRLDDLLWRRSGLRRVPTGGGNPPARCQTQFIADGIDSSRRAFRIMMLLAGPRVRIATRDHDGFARLWLSWSDGAKRRRGR